jgi:hypothetical protein
MWRHFRLLFISTVALASLWSVLPGVANAFSATGDGG